MMDTSPRQAYSYITEQDGYATLCFSLSGRERVLASQVEKTYISPGEALLPCTKTEHAGGALLSYPVGRRISLARALRQQDAWPPEQGSAMLVAAMEQLCRFIQACHGTDYSPENLSYSADHLYWDPVTKTAAFVYFPYETGQNAQACLAALTQKLFCELYTRDARLHNAVNSLLAQPPVTADSLLQLFAGLQAPPPPKKKRFGMSSKPAAPAGNVVLPPPVGTQAAVPPPINPALGQPGPARPAAPVAPAAPVVPVMQPTPPMAPPVAAVVAAPAQASITPPAAPVAQPPAGQNTPSMPVGQAPSGSPAPPAAVMPAPVVPAPVPVQPPASQPVASPQPAAPQQQAPQQATTAPAVQAMQASSVGAAPANQVPPEQAPAFSGPAPGAPAGQMGGTPASPAQNTAPTAPAPPVANTAAATPPVPQPNAAAPQPAPQATQPGFAPPVAAATPTTAAPMAPPQPALQAPWPEAQPERKTRFLEETPTPQAPQVEEAPTVFGDSALPRIWLQAERDGTRAEYYVEHYPTVIGRSSQKAQLVLPDEEVSRAHAQLWMQDGSVGIVDLRSSNGVYLNGTRLPAENWTALHSGDSLKLGRTTLTVTIG